MSLSQKQTNELIAEFQKLVDHAFWDDPGGRNGTILFNQMILEGLPVSPETMSVAFLKTKHLMTPKPAKAPVKKGTLADRLMDAGILPETGRLNHAKGDRAVQNKKIDDDRAAERAKRAQQARYREWKEKRAKIDVMQEYRAGKVSWALTNEVRGAARSALDKEFPEYANEK